jgi:tetratricopeptide (TPR) repeat protein
MKTLFLAGLLALVSGLTGLVAQQKQPAPKSEKEVEALQAMFQAQDPDSRIKAAESLITKFADTEFKAVALYMIAASYEQKNDFEMMMIYAERTLEADPKNYASMLMLATGLAKRAREHDLDLEEKLTRSDKYAKSALETLKDAPKPNPQLTDEQWEAAKKDFNAQAHETFALAAMLRKKYDVAISEFKQAVDGAATPDPATMVRLAQVYNLAGKPDLAIPVLDKVMAGADVHPQIKQFAQDERKRAIQAKGGTANPAATPPAPPAGAAPEPKKQ